MKTRFKKKKNWYKSLFFLVLNFSFLSLSGCRVITETSEKAQEDKKISSEIVKNYIENAFVENILQENVFKTTSPKLVLEFENTNSEFYKNTKEAFDFYQKYQVSLDPTFSLKLVADLQEKNALSSADFAILSAQAGYNKLFDSQAFIILYKNFATGISQIVNKMLLVKYYLVSLESDLIKDSQIYKDGIAASASFTTKEIFENIDPNSPDFFLIHLLLTKNPVQIWQFESSDQSSISTFSQLKVKDLNSFNNLLRSENITSKLTRKEKDFEKLAKNDSLDTTNMLGYAGILYRQDANLADLSFQFEDLRKQGEVKSGFLDPQSNRIWSSEQIRNFSLINKAKMFPVELRQNFDFKTGKDKVQISDFEIKNDNSLPEAKYKIKAIIPSREGSGNNFFVSVIVEIELGSAKYFYNVDVSWDETKAYYYPEIKPQGEDLPKLSQGIPTTFKDLSKISVKYVNKLAPLYDKIVQGENEKRAYFSLENTPWNTQEQKIKLAYSLYLADETGIYRDAKNFFEGIGYKIESKDEIIKLD
ncbi:HinT-interacting membrane complex lipoprotein P60 [Mesomycoplasma hyopneumoniae]|uniref:P60-like lipoprotein n=1 Tax=Mesomycoplasma hyopneumoniae TaxID=2099 RepID=A0ABD4SXM9_MESHO|nr:hypothetical protein [Mesomycoplasma hyopneumoniae]MCI8283399.1 hypothetical protein [Mesomycoplasma hyopneumoniae]MCI8298330.1 hypothetical protein [Mesomycoplasma hyopneumoniae]